MRIVNAMFGCGLGGIEQDLIDYCQASLLAGHTVAALHHPRSAVLPSLKKLSKHLILQAFRPLNRYDLFAVYRIRRFLTSFKPDVIITHGNRPLCLLALAAKGIAPIVAVTHNYKLQHIHKADYVFALTEDLKKEVIRSGFPQHKIFHLPNMIDVASYKPHVLHHHKFHKPPVIGAMGRFVHKKGFDLYLQSLALLKQRGVSFHALLGGAGEEDNRLRALLQRYDLHHDVDFLGWVKDKSHFFNHIDLFCLPSRHEPFGIILLEAFAHAKPVVSLPSEGPQEIIQHKKNAWLVPKQTPEALADGLAHLLSSPQLAFQLGQAGSKTVQQSYDLRVISKRLDQILKDICHA